MEPTIYRVPNIYMISKCIKNNLKISYSYFKYKANRKSYKTEKNRKYKWPQKISSYIILPPHNMNNVLQINLANQKIKMIKTNPKRVKNKMNKKQIANFTSENVYPANILASHVEI